MKELYFVNGNKKNGKTWRELLQGFYNSINNKESRRIYSWKDGWHYRPEVKAYDHMRFNAYFSDYRHNDNDWGYWTNGQYERVFIGFDEERREKIYVNGDWIPPRYEVPVKGWYVEDSFGRIIPSGYIKACLREFKPFIATEPKRSRKAWRRRGGNFVFRRGPVEGIKNWSRGSNWQRYRGDHGDLGNEVRQDSVFKTEVRDLECEYGIRIKYNKGRAEDVRSSYVDWDRWDYHGWSTKGVGWKRSRKEKQWM